MKIEIISKVSVNRESDPELLDEYSSIALLLSSMSVDKNVYGSVVMEFDKELSKQPIGKKFKITIEEIN